MNPKENKQKDQELIKGPCFKYSWTVCASDCIHGLQEFLQELKLIRTVNSFKEENKSFYYSYVPICKYICIYR